MVKQMNSIKKDIDILFEKINDSSNYKDYVNVIKKMKKNDEITNLIKEIKRLQKILVNEKDKVVEKELENLYKKLESYPIYQSYLIKKESLEEDLFNVKETFEKYFKDILNLI